MNENTNIYIPSSAPEPTQNGPKCSAMLNIQKRTVSFRLPSHPSTRRNLLVTLLSSHWIRRSGHQNGPFLRRTADDGSGLNRGLHRPGRRPSRVPRSAHWTSRLGESLPIILMLGGYLRGLIWKLRSFFLEGCKCA